MVSREAVLLISLATEEFVKRISEASHRLARRENRMTVQRKDIGAPSVAPSALVFQHFARASFGVSKSRRVLVPRRYAYIAIAMEITRTLTATPHETELIPLYDPDAPAHPKPKALRRKDADDPGHTKTMLDQFVSRARPGSEDPPERVADANEDIVMNEDGTMTL